MIELKYDIAPDEFGVVDGKQLAASIIHTAANLLIPYVRACPGCLDYAFERIANDVLEQVREELQAGKKDGLTYIIGHPGAEGEAALAAHLAANERATRALLNGASGHNE